MELKTKPGGLPNFFYDIIVFLIPTLLFAIGLVFGMGWEQSILNFVSSNNIEGWRTFWLVLAMLLASYEYGRLAETFSDTFVRRPILFLHGKKVLFKNKDFCRDLSHATDRLKLDSKGTGSCIGSKWVVYVFALVFTPALGADLLKRYAWEKLARSSAFSCVCLLFISVCVRLGSLMLDQNANQRVWCFGGIGYTGVTCCCYFILCIDYYKRNCWNNDLLITIVPVLARAAETLKTSASSNDKE
jgi:hypothetical protein